MFKIFKLGKNKILKFLPERPKDKFSKIPYLQLEEIKSQAEINTELLNFNLFLIPIILAQEYEIIKLQGYQQVDNNSTYLYNLLYLGLKENFLEYSDIKPLIEAFYQTNRIDKKQYLTLTKHYYIDNRECEI